MPPFNQSELVIVTGQAIGLRPGDTERVGAYLVVGRQCVAEASLTAEGRFGLEIAAPIFRGSEVLTLVIGPAGGAGHLGAVPGILKIALPLAAREDAGPQFEVSGQPIKVSEDRMRSWRLWCRPYSLTGTVVDSTANPVPEAEVTVYSVAFGANGEFEKAVRAKSFSDGSGKFAAAFNWCRTPGWPKWPLWWLSCPPQWENDILYVIGQIERTLARTDRRAARVESDPVVLSLNRPDQKALLNGRGFQPSGDSKRLLTNRERAELIRLKLSDPKIREMFPWWWWCSDAPGIVFKVAKGPRVLLEEGPLDTRWCLPDGSNIALTFPAMKLGGSGRDAAALNCAGAGHSGLIQGFRAI